jgi:hypothetical protein
MKSAIAKSTFMFLLRYTLLSIQPHTIHGSVDTTAQNFFTDIGSGKRQIRLLASAPPAKPKKSDNVMKVEGNCKPAPNSQCELCQGGARSGHEGCEETGKRQNFYCEQKVDSDDDDKADDSPISYFFSCKRTRVEEEYLVMRLQGLCALVAFMSLRNVRRERILSESLFDNRKRLGRHHPPSKQLQHELVPLSPSKGGSYDDDEEAGRFSGAKNGNVHTLHQQESSEN